MPLRWTISHPERLVIAVAEGLVGLKDIEAYLDDVVVSAAMPYRKLFDATAGSSALADDDMMALGARMRAYPRLDLRIGPLAVVAGSDTVYGLARLFGALADVDRPFQIFRDARTAREWLDKVEAGTPPVQN